MSTWYELLIAGPQEALEGFLERHGGAVVDGSKLPLAEGSLTERVLGFLGARTHHLLFAPAENARALARGLEQGPDLRLEHLREIEDAAFSFEARTYSHEKAEEIRSALRSGLPPEISLVDFEESEKVDPEAQGVELYAPAHDYTYRASGSFHGAFPGILAIHRRLEELELCTPGPIAIQSREAAGLSG